MVKIDKYEEYERIFLKKRVAKKMKKMPILPEDRYKGRKLNQRIKKKQG